jgi:hypothetical protein
MTTETTTTTVHPMTALRNALVDLDTYAKDYVYTYGTDVRELSRIISNNRSGWSGGFTSENNIFEAFVLKHAIEELNVLTRGY